MMSFVLVEDFMKASFQSIFHQIKPLHPQSNLIQDCHQYKKEKSVQSVSSVFRITIITDSHESSVF